MSIAHEGIEYFEAFGTCAGRSVLSIPLLDLPNRLVQLLFAGGGRYRPRTELNHSTGVCQKLGITLRQQPIRNSSTPTVERQIRRNVAHYSPQRVNTNNCSPRLLP
ncbi:hypothetical protein D3C77_196340 [compost metagenome]